MGKLNKTVGGILLILTLISTHGTAQAASHHSKKELSAQEAAAIVQRRTGGQALGVREEVRNGRKVYRVRVVTPQGQVREVTVNARPPRN